MALSPKENIAALGECAHGGFNYAELAELKVDCDSLLDFSVSTNPFMPPPGLREIVAGARLDRYPDSASTRLHLKLAEKLGLVPENIVTGAGTTELIRLLALAYLGINDAALVLGPTYGEYEAACRLAGARAYEYGAAAAGGFMPDVTEIRRMIQAEKPRMLFLCNPNNPTGRYLRRREILQILEALDGGLFILDESYLPFVEKKWNSLELLQHDNVVLLRSMTKDYGIPGLRLGYALAGPEISSVLRSVLPPWNVNAVAQEAGLFLLDNEKALKESLAMTRGAAQFLTGELARLGFNVMPSAANFFLVYVGDARQCRRLLLERGILVRDCASFGLPCYIRVSARPVMECSKLAYALGDLLAKKQLKV